MRRELTVWLDQQQVGRLLSENDRWSLEYSPEWQASNEGYGLSPALSLKSSTITDGASQRPVQWFFDNLLPEEGQRRLIANHERIEVNDTFGLLAVYGKESFGAISLLSPGEQLEHAEPRRLTLSELQERIEELPEQSLVARAPKKMSLAGAQHKLPIIMQGEELFEPVGAIASTHILKPDHHDNGRYPHTTANEYFCMRLAKIMDIEVPDVYLKRCPSPVFIIGRYDRYRDKNRTVRQHSIDACQLLNIDRAYKYQSVSSATMRACIDACRTKAVARQFIFKWTVFNLLIGNNDAHLKNLSFKVDAHGVVTAPAYDLLATGLYPFRADRPADVMTQETAMPVGNARVFGDLKPHDIPAFAEEIGLGGRVAERIIGEMCGKVLSAAEDLYAEYCRNQSGNIAGELRLLRAIIHSTIKPMRVRIYGI